MRKIYLFIFMQIATATAFTQIHEPGVARRPEPVNPIRDKQEYGGYTIRLIPAMPLPGAMNNYGFEILKDKKPVVHESQNPMPFSAKGIQKKEDAYKIAQWIIREYESTGHWQTIIQPHVARQLKLDTFDK